MRDRAATIGILGAGKLGTVLARLAVASGSRVLISGSGTAERIALIVEVLSPGAEARTSAEVVAEADVVILALPLGRLRGLPGRALDGVVTVDPLNYWEPIDGYLEEYATRRGSTSELVRAHLPGARLVKAFNHLGYHQLEEGARPAGASDRLALALASDDAEAQRIVAELVDRLGFDPVPAGPLASGTAFEAGTPAFGVPLSATELAEALREAGAELPSAA